MGNSDSDSENECFESAEESLDEDEEVKSVKRKSKKSETEVAELHCDNVESTPQLEKDVSVNSTSYRKRPDRVKRTNSNTTTKVVPKLPSTDVIFKADKIVPDAFFQDITSNLSKNINKSLSTLQQKSSNVKDLILSSLPVSSVNDEEGFSYDDNSTQSLPEESEISKMEEELQSKDNSDQLIGKIIKERTIKEEESCREEELISETKTNSPVVDILDDSNKERKPPDLGHKSEENSFEEDFNLKGSKLGNNIEEEASNLAVNEKRDALDSGTNKEDEDAHKEETESESEKVKENLEVTDGAFLNSSDVDILNTEGANSSDIKKEELISPSPPVHEPVQSNNFEIEENIDHNKFLESEKSNELSFDESNLVSSEPDTQTVEDNTNFIENEKNLNDLLEEKNEVDLKCNLDELKTALENIVQDKKSSEKSEISERECSKDVLSQEEKVEVDQNLNDGWDDFDFSDEEVENIMANKSNTINTDIKESVADNKIAVNEKTSSGVNKTSLKTDTKVVNKPASKTERRNNEEVTKKPEQNPEPEEISDDTWDWDDSWGETPEDKTEKATVTSKSKNEKTKDESSDVSKWTGWDTFAQKPQEKQGNWGLGSWGVDMLLNKATAVTQGLSNVLEAGLGAPDPETLARMEKLEKEKLKEEIEEMPEYSGEVAKKNSLTNVNLFPVSGITSLVAGVTSKIVEHSKIQEIGSKVITGGLDTLETFGKKTMEVLQEGDPGLKNKRALLMGNNKPVLSQVLKEAREKADREMKKAEEKELAKKCHFETLFDDFQGMVHLEALEMLSKQCELKLEQIRSGMNSEEQEDLNGILEEVEQLCALDECELDLKSSVLDFKTVLQMAVEPLKNEISVHKIIQVHENVNKWLEMSSETKPSLIIVNQKLVSTLAELAAATVQQFHKSGELLSVKECRKTVEEVDALSRLTNILCTEINRLCEKFISLSRNKSSAEGSGDSLNSMTEKVTVVMNNSTSYIRQAFDLLIPVLQLGAAV